MFNYFANSNMGFIITSIGNSLILEERLNFRKCTPRCLANGKGLISFFFFHFSDPNPPRSDLRPLPHSLFVHNIKVGNCSIPPETSPNVISIKTVYHITAQL